MLYKFRFLIFLTFIFLLFIGQTQAQFDPTFGTNGVATSNINNANSPMGSFLLPDGKIFVVNNGGTNCLFARFNSNGTIDTTYGTNGIVQFPIPFISTTNFERNINKAFRQPDGKIILVGRDNGGGLVMRINENGTFDTSFAGTGVQRIDVMAGNDDLTSAAILSDGKIVIVGNNNGLLLLARYQPNGTLDASFGIGGFVIHSINNGLEQVRHLYVQSNGKLMTSTASPEPFTNLSGAVRRFNSDGTADNTFTVISSSDRFRASALQNDDKILIAKTIYQSSELGRASEDVQISRYDANGNLDTAFGTNGRTSFDVTNSYFDDLANALAVEPDGEILVSSVSAVAPNRSSFRSQTISIVRLTASGAINGRFLQTGCYIYTNTHFLLYPDGRLVTVFVSSSLNLVLTRLVNVPLINYRLKGVPFDFYLNGTANTALFRPSERKWYILNNFPQPGFSFGLSDDVLVPADYYGSLASDLAVFRPSNGTWYIAHNLFNPGANYVAVQWGLNGDIPAPADYLGDSKTDIAVFRPSNGTWYIYNLFNNSYTIRQWGLNGDKPVAGDYDGDGFDDIAVWRPSDGVWYILKSSDGQPMIVRFGLNGDKPVQEDYDGDGKTDIAVWRPSNGVWYRLNSSDGSFFAFNWGFPDDVPVPADYDGDLKTDISVWRPSNRFWYINQSATNSPLFIDFGLSGDIPVQGKY